ncbi:RagB/SusD family nutrient uptake outer membrane protein [Tellurirhabdus bombi]|uniref:RagB/SusD family nutrient uptake outer membrane protein n=1 Tax=Tellurirhabdus bombi TaxID=2907205 RepID=UPI001F316F5A|nr:RagB/SusD family nutrient uptake outer membrane protein [Tellurirhabdus bombi]
MKRITKLFHILLPAVLLTTAGCENYLDRAPLADLSPNTFFATRGDMRTWVAGTYDAAQEALNGNQAAHLEWGDLRSDNYGNTGYGDTRVYMNAIDASQSQWDWQYLYRVIDRCNVGIARFPTVPNLLPNDYNDNVGQCYGLRALMYFYAIRVWGAVPLVTQPWDGDLGSSRVARSSVEDIKKQILSDLDEAMARLALDVSGPRKFYFNMGAARALKTDVHMWFKEYDKAVAASDYFVGNTNYALVANDKAWKDMFTNPAASTETIFNLHWAIDLTDGTNAWAQRVGASNTNNTYRVSQTIFNEFVNRRHSGKGADGRFWNSIDTVRLWRNGNRVPVSYNHYLLDGIQKCVKYSAVNPNRATAADDYWLVLSTNESFVQVPIYRLADVLTLRAEALNQLGRSSEALTIVNNIRRRVGYLADAATEVATTDKKAVEGLILKERQLEFMCEGKRWFDLQRTDRLLEVMDPVMRQRQEEANVTITGFGDIGRALFPIFYREFEANPALKGHQNPPYTEG